MTQRKPYNYNTKYGRRKLREQADYKYQTGTPEYRQSIDEIGCGVWAVIIVLVLVVVVIIAMVSGPEAAVKWLSH